jgi:pimeloyl-ACP methyl ester carboxylesterase
MSKMTLVLVPGLMCDQAAWAAQSAALGALVPRLTVADHGRADSLADMARALLAAHAGPLAIAGHSMGGRVALEVARLAADRLCGLALLDTGYRALDPGPAGARELEGRMRLLDQARREGVRAMAANWVRDMLHPARLQDRALIEAILDMFERRDAEHFAAQIKALIERPDATAVLAQVRCPTLLLCGEQDRWSAPPQHREMHSLIAGSRLTIVPDCGHMSLMERPQAVNAALADWLQLCLQHG